MKSAPKPHGQIRRSQVITTFGPGALVDLPKHSVIVGGLDHWSKSGRQEVREPRLVEKLRAILQVPQLQLFTPPPEPEEPGAPSTGISVFQFPEWFVTQDVRGGVQDLFGRSRRLVPRAYLEKGHFIDEGKKKRPVVPVRFVRACRKGHIDDIEWYAFVHGSGQNPCRRPLWLDERGTTGDLAEVWVRCDCGASRPMSHAAQMELLALGHCNGSRPWLGRFAKETCGEPSRLLLRSASNAYFPQTMSVISLPEGEHALVSAVDGLWDGYLREVESIEELRFCRKKLEPVRDGLAGFTDEAVLEEILRRKGSGIPSAPKSVKQAEFETLFSVKGEVGEDVPEGDFYAKAISTPGPSSPHMGAVERIVLVHRLREVIAQVGFTRFESVSPDVQGELEIGVQRASLALEPTWLPAVENRGEGIFVSFRKDTVLDWMKRPEVAERGRELAEGFERWKGDHAGTHREFPGLPYIFLHTLSHLLITAVSLECGYPASSLRERVYANETGFGILLYTGSPDAEGTLGGLVEAGRRFAHHISDALELGRLCSNDPVCSLHRPADANERRYLLGAACHGCLLISETCCEQRNDHLDRALVVATVAGRGAEFFGSTR